MADKDGLGLPLPAPIRRVLYLGSLQTSQMEEVMPANPSVLVQLENADAVIYGIGSLYTSICPSLILVVRFCDSCWMEIADRVCRSVNLLRSNQFLHSLATSLFQLR